MSINSLRNTVRRIALCTVALVCVGTALSTQPASALSGEQRAIYGLGAGHYDFGGDVDCSATTTGTVVSNANQDKIASIIIGIAKTDNLGQKGALIGLMVALAESSLKIYANSNVPVSMDNPNKQAVGHDHDSVGVFQQRPSTDWSTIATGSAALDNKEAVYQLMDPAYSAEAFFGSPKGSNAPAALGHGLQNIDNWQGVSPWIAAQKVQGSAFGSGSNYRAQMAAANGYLTKLWDSSPAIPLPVPVTGGAGTAANADGGGAGCAGAAVSLTGGTGKFTDSTTVTLPNAAKAVARAKTLADMSSTLYKATCGAHSGNCKRMCDYLAGVAWGYANSGSYDGTDTAMAHWKNMLATGHGHENDRNPPVGALLFYETGNPAGHIATYLGGNMVLSNDVYDAKTGHVGGAYVVPASALETGPWRLKYLGWSDNIFHGSLLTGSLAL